MPKHSFILNEKRVSVECPGDVRLLWVLRDLLGVHGPKYGCGLEVCKACTCHINGKAFNPCSVPVSKIKHKDRITTIEGLPASVGKKLHPMQQAWLDYDVAQCGYCQPGQIMAAVALVEEAQAEGRKITEAELDSLRNVCRCGTYFRIREAIQAGAKVMGEGLNHGVKRVNERDRTRGHASPDAGAAPTGRR
jgi:isoquinoline 1-oxidoreductase alpha subunit